MKSWLLALAAAAAVQAQKNVRADCTKAPLSENGVCDTSLSPAKRAAALVAAMTSDEKLQNLVSLSKGASRLGLPAYNWWSEALHGVAAAPGVQFTHGDLPFNTTTSFPMPLLMASSFDDELIEQVGVAIGTEGRAFGNFGFSGFDFWTPNVNPYRDPRWGRGSETAGEDILRIKRYADSMIRGMQGPKENPRVIATCKHFAANDIESWHGTTRHNFDAKLTAQDMAEYYLMPFQQCARDSKVGSIMCAYNAVNGIPSCANSYLMNTIVRDHWNWTEHNNYITSDCEAVADIYNPHHYANTLAAATADAFNAGMDTSCEYSGSSDIPGAWSQGLLKIETVNRALLRLYEGLVWVGYFDGTNATYGKLDWSDVDTPNSQSVARAAAAESIMLLKNDGTLPLTLTPNKTKVAMIGFWADSADEMSGGYSGTPAYRHSPVYIAKQMGLSVTQASGPILQTTAAADNWTAPALAAANSSDYIIYFGGLDTTAAGEGEDRLTLNWPTAQVALVQKLAALGKPLIVVQLGDPIDETPMLTTKGVNSLLYANYPSQEGSAALWEIISGAVAPAGRLPVTLYPENYTAVNMTDMTLRPSATNPGRTYRWFPSPVMEFGFGLHYTKFKTSFALCSEHTYAIADLVKGCNNNYQDTCPFPSLPVEVSNQGNRTSDFVVLAFVAGKYGPKPYPIKTLASYARVKNVEPGKSKTATLKWSLGDIARHDEMGNTVLYPGTYTVMIDVPTQSELKITLTGEPLVLDKWPALPGSDTTASA